MDRILLFIMRAALALTLPAGIWLATTDSGSVGVSAINDKLAHLFGFYVLALLADFSYPRSGFGLSKILPLLSYGLLIEIVQFFIPYRSFSLLDLAADGAGLMLYGLTLLLLRRAPFIAWRWAFVRR